MLLHQEGERESNIVASIFQTSATAKIKEIHVKRAGVTLEYAHSHSYTVYVKYDKTRDEWGLRRA